MRSAKRAIPRLLRENQNFRRFFIGQGVSLLGDQITTIALPLTAVLALHAGAGQMGVLTTLYLIPNLLFSLHVGVWTDRRGKRRHTMILADFARGLITLTIPIAYAFGELTWTQLYIVAFLLGSFSVLFMVTYGGFFQTIVAREDYVSANSIVHGTRGASFLVGNSLGGALVQLLRGPYALAVDAVTFFWSALFLGRIDAEEPPGVPRESGGVLSGLRWIRGNAIIRAELLGVATLNLFNFMFFALFLLYATNYLHVSPLTLGLVLGIAAVGTVAASFFAGRGRPKDRDRAGVHPRLLPLPGAAHPHTGGGRAAMADHRLALRRRAPLRGRSDVPRHPRRDNQCRHDPDRDARTRLRWVPGRQLRRAASRNGARRRARRDDRRPLDALDRDGRRVVRTPLPAAVADPHDA